MHTGAEWIDVTILNVSSHGLMMRAPCGLGRGSYVEVRRGTLTIVARVIWSRDEYLGLRSQDRLSAKDIVSEPRLIKRPDPAVVINQAERRSNARRAIDARAERSQRFASAFQFAAIGGAGACAAVAVFSIVSNVLGGMSAMVRIALGG
jgi:hypothetical protein